MSKRILTFSCNCILLGLSALLLGGCGIKPDSLTPPPGAEDKVFPRTYPDPATDPAP